MKNPSPLMFFAMFVLSAIYVALSPAIPNTFWATVLFGTFWCVLAWSLSDSWFERLKGDIWSVLPIPVMVALAIYETNLVGGATTFDGITAHSVLTVVWLWIALLTGVLFARRHKHKLPSV